MNSEQVIRLKIEGEQFEDTCNLYYLTKVLSDFHSVLDKSYLTIKESKKITENDRKVFQVKSLSFCKGSFVADLSIAVLSTVQMAIPSFLSLTSKDIWDLTVQGYEYLKFVLEANFKGEPIRIENSGDNNMLNVINGSNNKVIQIFPQVIPHVEKAAGDYERLVNNIDSKIGVSNISALTDKFDCNASGIRVSDYEKEIFKGKTRIEKEPIVFNGQIYKIDGFSFTGRLVVLKADDKNIVEGKDYCFEFMKKDDINELSRAFMKEKKITALKHIVMDPTTLREVTKRINIIDIED